MRTQIRLKKGEEDIRPKKKMRGDYGDLGVMNVHQRSAILQKTNEDSFRDI